jgi:hypothetical protein
MVKQNIDKLLVAGFVESIKEATWLSPIVIVPKKNGKLRICIDFKKLNATTKKDPHPLPFTYEVLNIVAEYEAYSLDDIQDIMKYLQLKRTNRRLHLL